MTEIQIHKTLRPLLFLLGLLVGLPAMAVQARAQGGVVGEMISVIGVGKIINTQGENPAARGNLVRAGDQIETSAGGHVHVRFADGGLISVRPQSRLIIEDYRDRDSENFAAIKFRLEVGVVRSVSGQWGEANRDRFRLNTPVAAIGIKGTDFVVKANGSSTLASVSSGAIVMAPLEGACAVGLGPCSGERSTLLSADMGAKMLQYLKESDVSSPRLIPYVDLLARNSRPSQVTVLREVDVTRPAASANKAEDNQNSGTQIVETILAAATPARPPAPAAPAAPATPIAPATPVTPVVPESKSLAWFHNVMGWNIPTNTISTRFDEASAAGRQAVVGNFFVTLYRDASSPKEFTPPSNTVNFKMLNASANYAQLYSGLAPEPVTIKDAKLSVDFARSTLSTQMDLSSPLMGQDRFVGTAKVSSEGFFVGTDNGQKLAGALSTDARQAGYLFEKTLKGGTVSGLTLWGP